jgi:transcription elongation factor GreA
MTQRVITADGFAKLKAELHELKKVKLPDVIEKIERAKELGDLSENAEYHDAKDNQGMINARIVEIESALKNAIIADTSDSSSRIGLGSTFVVEDAEGAKKEFTMVSFNEADPAAGKISNESPLGAAFAHKRPGDEVEVEVPKGILTYKILEIK